MEDFNFEASPVKTTASVPELLSTQMNIELNNFHAYINLSSISDIAGYTGAAKFFKNQADGELDHFNKFRKFICDRNFVPLLTTINQKQVDNFSLLDMMSQAYELEVKTTNELTALKSALLISTTDYIAIDFLDWFFLEQLEEMNVTSQFVKRLKLADTNTAAILIVDQELEAL